MSPEQVEIRDEQVTLPAGPTLALRTASGGPGAAERPPFLLVHGLASNARLWDGVAPHLAAAGHDVIAVDQRGHGRSEQTDGGYDTSTCAADLADLIETLGLSGRRTPVVAGQSWGGNVALTLAAVHGKVAALALLDGGWIRLQERFATFEDCWAVLAPPAFDDLTYDDLATRIAQAHPDWPASGIEATLANLRRLPDGGVTARLARDHHRDILRSLWEGDPRELYPLVRVPSVLMPAADPAATEGREADTVRAVEEAAHGLRDSTVRWYAGADHDLHAQHPRRVARDLLSLCRKASGHTKVEV